ncbi:C2 domain-containing protein [Cavenderia fasciculata]|uniref:C2 domain-containing protein n=1 Tax=Cavenderia fasciculata TaxID=261658 RepID=F4PID2_CACFS|nr:C2 domain-containing protein [Cavenderia fasciculata]EGG24566.1 C2 domain-containing protein [Cavenderia fasciculata]|eukprot:XP_004362417.1 C2 domain-containing protein [Cavenderia fasciculata]
MSIYEDIIRSQGNFGGKKGPFAYLADKKKKKPTKEIKFENWLAYSVTVTSAELFKATDSNGLSDPYVRVGKVGNDGLFSKKWVLQTPAIPKIQRTTRFSSTSI